ncbi:MAG: Lrp/AsnC family transcriptional regulator [Desulfobacterales bacterium]
MPTELQKQIIAEFQGDMPIAERPYLIIAKRLGITEETLLETLREFCEEGIIRRFGATLRHQKSGYTANAMTAWMVDEDRVEFVGEQMASFAQVSHCYRRNPTPEWPYNLYTMIHGMSEESCRETAGKISEETSVTSYTVLFSRRELKKTSMVYFPSSHSDVTTG